jgi:nitroreductase
MTVELESLRGVRRLQLARCFFVQTPLLNPGFGGTGKWSVVIPSTRKAYQASQVDRHRNPPLFDLLSRVAAGADPNGPDVDQLIAAGMVEVETEEGGAAGSFTDLFHEFVTDYPFYDYSNPQWLDDDIQRMRDFKQVEPPPPITTPRPGMRLLQPSTDGREEIADTLAAIIRHTFKAVGAIEGFPVGPWHRKAMPSGGARHPIEAWVDVPRTVGWLPAGVHVYDVADNALRETGLVSRGEFGTDESAPPAVVYLRARVDRAMWRYRDARSWRAILVDAGHCAQMVATNAELRGWQVEVCTPPRGVDGDHNWLDEPWLLAIVLRPDASQTSRQSLELLPPSTVGDDDQLVTQPFLYGTFGAVGQLAVRDVAAGSPERVIDELDLAIMTHCLYSKRGDRPSDAGSIEELFGSEGPARRTALVADGLLWPQDRGHEVIKAVRGWSDKGWYLTALAHADVRSNATPATVRLSGGLGLSAAELDQVISTRRTCRTFDSGYVLPREDFDRLLASLRSLLSATPFGTTVIVAPTAVEGLPAAFYRWQNEQLEAMAGVVDQALIRDATIGQAPAGAGSVTLWIAVDVDADDPGSYELRASTLGMLGQRLCLLATHLGLGVFVTPAVKDSETSALFDYDLRRTLAYTVTIGRNTTESGSAGR